MRWLRAIPIVVVSAAVIFICGELVASAVNITTKLVTVPAVVTLTQGDYRWYENVNSLTPVTALATEDQEITTPSAGSVLRLRMNVQDTQLQLASGATFKLQYANSTSSGWVDVGTSTAWVFFDNPSVADGQIIVDTLLSSSNVGESYDESNPSAATPNNILPGQRGEWDWVLANNSADTQSNWFFRMVYASGTALDAYLNFPALAAASPPPPPPPPAGGGGGSVSGGGNFPATTAKPPIFYPPPLIPPALQFVDLNGDNRVDIVDLSILLYHYGESGPNLPWDLDGDGVVDFPDISIMMFYWTS
jgi:hypothetical protein